MLNTEKLRGNGTHLFSPLSDPDSPGHFLLLQQPWLQARWKAWKESCSSSCRAKLDHVPEYEEEGGTEKRKEAKEVQGPSVEKHVESREADFEGSAKMARMVDKASAEQIIAEDADRRERSLVTEEGGKTRDAREVEISTAKPSFVIFPHFQAVPKKAQQRQPGKCESARALEPIRAERSSNGSCEADSALQLRCKSWSERQRSKPTRGNISEVRSLQKRHLYIGRSASHLGCARSFWANPFPVKRYGLQGAISSFETLLHSSQSMQRQLVQLTDRVLLCHCSLTERCHGDVLIRAWEKKFLDAEGQDSEAEAAQAEELFRAADQRSQVEEPESQSDDEPGQEPRGAGWRGNGEPLLVGRGPHEREVHTMAQDSARQADGPLKRGSCLRHKCCEVSGNS